MAKRDRCTQVKRSDALVIWDDPNAPKGNVGKVQAHGLNQDEVESVLLDDNARVLPNRSHPEHCLVVGYTYTGRFIVVPFEIVDEKTPAIRPITAFEPSEDKEA
ncbi:MAG: hypothetical protein ACLP7Q_24365 [Isosphaeraceae bacterium]